MTNTVWQFTTKVASTLAQFVVSLVLARILEPALFGKIALVTVITSVLVVFVDSGLGVSLVQKKEADDIDFSSVFYVNLGLSLALYLMVFMAAPYIASYYNYPDLTPVIRALGTSLIVSGVMNIQRAYVQKTLQFRKFFYASLPATIIAGICGITLAYKGFGVWALVANNLLNCVVNAVILFCVINWRPKLIFSINRIKGLFDFGWKMFLSALLNTLYVNLTSLIIGKKYSAQDLAFYNKGFLFPSVVAANINYSIDGVLFPAMTEVQDVIERVRSMTRRAIRISSYIICPFMMGLAFCGEPLIRFLLTDKWMESVQYLQVFCISFMFLPIHTANLSAIKALGRSDLFLYLEIAKKVIGLIAILISMQYSPIVMAYTFLGTNVLSQIINSWPNKKLLNYPYLQQLRDIIPNILLAVFMGCCIWPLSLLNMPDIVTLLCQFVLGVVIYIAGSKLFKYESFNYILQMLPFEKLKKFLS